MPGKTTIRLKAFFLLVVFSINTVLGFACSIGVDLGYNKLHHHTEKQRHSHAVEHQHETEGHHHGHDSNDNEAMDHDSPAKAHDCCKDVVLKFNLSDKSVSSSVKIHAPAMVALNIVALYFISALHAEDILSNHYYVRSDHPPIARDIRIAIHSFQV